MTGWKRGAKCIKTANSIFQKSSMSKPEVSTYIKSSKGDELQINLLPLDGRYISQEVRDLINGKIEVLMVELDRIKGQAPVGHLVLSQIEQIVAKVFADKRNTLLCFLCDFLSPVPQTRKTIPCQEYRSRLFTKMFERYISKHAIEEEVIQTVIAINGIRDTYYIHLIARREHMQYVQIISEDIKIGFSK